MDTTKPAPVKVITDKYGNTYTLYWIESMKCYCTLDEPELCPVCGDRMERHPEGWVCR